MREVTVAVTTHGRVLIDAAADAAPLKILAGFHGYAQNAGEMMAMLRRVPVDDAWTRVSVQALHRFYRGRSQVTVASWMTREDRELLIADNLAYVDAALAEAAGGRPIARLACCGFSQGVAMAFRTALLGARRADLVLALGSDVPPDVLNSGGTWPTVLLGRGVRDEWYTEEKAQADEAALRARGVAVEMLSFDGAHEWHDDFGSRAAQVMRAI